MTVENSFQTSYNSTAYQGSRDTSELPTPLVIVCMYWTCVWLYLFGGSFGTKQLAQSTRLHPEGCHFLSIHLKEESTKANTLLFFCLISDTAVPRV